MIWSNRAQLGTPVYPRFQGIGMRILQMRTSLCFLSLLAMPGLAAAQTRSLSTRHVREVTLNGQAQLVGKLPATNSMHLHIVLPVRDQAGLKKFLQQLHDPSSPSYKHFIQALHNSAGVHGEVWSKSGGL